ncbi:uncharacterized protein GBIM_07180 [Gryllus bimaculatus]|nr:uncharacterized protein GBIM_07180 [Gryllus bimaculatus]
MVVMYSFCFWFSVRLGSIIVGVTSLVQALAFLILCCVGLEDRPTVSETIKDWLDKNEMLFLKAPLTDMSKDPEGSLVFFTSFTAIYAFCCLLLMYGAYRCNLMLMYPFMGLDLLRLIFLSICFVFAMILVKENLYNLGLLIGFSVGGGFVLLYLFYMWFCTLSMCQIVKELEKMEDMIDPYNNPPVPTPDYGKKFTMDTSLAVGMNYYDNGYNYLSRPIY